MSDQGEFSGAILDPGRAAPAGLIDPAGRPAVKRFDVYRNNVALSLTEALQATFPVLQQLVGEEFFTAMVGQFLRQHPPRSPVLMYYGQDMPAFLEAFDPVQGLGYLPDVARLELAVVASYHAGDAAAIDGAGLAEMAPDALLGARIELAPPVRMIRSAWPLYDIWRANTGEPGHPIGDRGQAVLVTRPEFDPSVQLMPPGGPTFVQALLDGKTFGSAQQEAALRAPDFDLSQVLSLLLGGGAITKIDEDRE